MVFPLLLHFADLFLNTLLATDMLSLRALAALIHEAQEATFGRGDHRKMAVAASHHLSLFRETYGDEHVKPKHHYVCHLPRQLSRDKFLIDAFTLERKHQEVKKAATNTDNTSDYEVSLLSRLHLDELRSQASLHLSAGLRGPEARHEPLGAMVADGLECRGLRL